MSVLTGCSADDQNDGEAERNGPTATIAARELYFGPGFDREIPEFITRVERPEDSVMAVLDRETTVDGDTVVDWLRAGTPVCVVGSPAGPRLEALLRDGSATEHFDGPMVSGGDRAFDAVGVAPVESGRRLVSSSVDGPAGDDAWIHAVDGVLEGLELDAE